MLIELSRWWPGRQCAEPADWRATWARPGWSSGPDRGLGGQVVAGGRSAVDSLIRGFRAAEGAHQGGWPEERLTADVPAVAAEFFDEHPDHLAEGLRTLEGDYHVGDLRGHVMLLLFGEDSLDDLDGNQWHDVPSTGGDPHGCRGGARLARARSIRPGRAHSHLWDP